jgi:hypothetical protein
MVITVASTCWIEALTGHFCIVTDTGKIRKTNRRDDLEQDSLSELFDLMVRTFTTRTSAKVMTYSESAVVRPFGQSARP